MDIQNVEPEFIEQPVIDIHVEPVGAPGMDWTINDEPASEFRNSEKRIHFRITSFRQKDGTKKDVDIEVNIERENLAWSSVSRRIDRIPVSPMRKENAQQPNRRMDVNGR